MSQKIFLFEYRHRGALWTFKVPANDPEEAEARVEQMANARLVGELLAEVPAYLGPWARLLCVIRNFFAPRV